MVHALKVTAAGRAWSATPRGAAPQGCRPGGLTDCLAQRCGRRARRRCWTGGSCWCRWRRRSRWAPPAWRYRGAGAPGPGARGSGGPTIRRALDLAARAMLDRIARARARARAHVWMLISGTPSGFPWLAISGKTLAGWLVIDMDATLVTAQSDKEGAAPTWKKGYGFHPLGAWCANTRECLAMLLRPGNAGSHLHRPQGRAGRGPPASPCPFPPQDPHPRRRGRRQPRSRQAPAVDVLPAPDSPVHLRLDDHRRRRGRHRPGPRRCGSPASPRTRCRGGQGRRGDHAL